MKMNDPKPPQRIKKINEDIITECHNNLPQRLKSWLNEHGIPNKTADEYQLGYGCFYQKYWLATYPTGGTKSGQTS